MSKAIKCDTVPTWDEIEKRIIEPFDLDDVGVRYAVDLWRKATEKIQDTDDLRKVAHSLTSPEVLEAVISFSQADITENQAIFKVKTARNNRRLALLNITKALGEFQGVFVDEDGGEHIVPELLAVTRVSKSAKTKMLQQVIDASMSTAKNGKDDSDEIHWPSNINEDFRSDLEEFLAANQDEGREMVSRVCQNTDFAKKICNNQDMPKPIRFLAQVVIEAKSNNHLPVKERRIGFAGS